MFGILKRLASRPRTQKRQALKQQAERILHHDQQLARLHVGRADPVTDTEAAPQVVPQAAPPPRPASLPAGFEDELRRLSRLMDLDD